ncbi:MAG: hypothetical protein E7624_04130 [Ruminococcaceae bacterium]|nr:hypothetical protein [Oscillospiraceae bacterium]
MKIRITPGAVLLFSAMLLSRDPLFPATVIAAAIHECGHLLAAKLLGIRLRLLELDVPGARILPQGALPSYRAEVLLAAAGPAASLLLAALLFPFSNLFLRALLASTLSLGLFNLLPVCGFDGWRVLGGTLTPLLEEARAARVLLVCSYLSLFALFCFSATLLLRHGESVTLTVLSASLFARTFLGEERHGDRRKIN